MSNVPFGEVWFKVIEVKNGLIYTNPYKQTVTEGNLSLDYFYYRCRSAITLNWKTYCILPSRELLDIETLELLNEANIVENMLKGGIKPYEIIEFLVL